MAKPFYVTTPLYYVNAAPHIGHSYTEVAVDCLARYHRLNGEDVFFLTGTDEHGEKIAQAAAAKGLDPKTFADQAAETFRALWKTLDIEGSYTRFIRTTDPDHEATVQRLLEHLRPHLQLGPYRFWYCVPCETPYGLAEIDPASPLCPNCQRPLTQIEEQDYYLPLEPHRDWLRECIERQQMTILPVERRNEVLAMLQQPLPALCLTRPKERVPWGIAVPFSPEHVTYVWVDALINYISALGWPDDPKFARYWHEAGAIHVIGKDIIRHHALYWPIILHAAGIQPPKMIFAHGWWKVGEQKMSKSLGNIVDPYVVINELLRDQPYAADVYRYFLLREVPFGQDGTFSEEALRLRLQTDLANDLGNLVHRTLSMIERYTQSEIPTPDVAAPQADDDILRGDATQLRQRVDAAMASLDFSGGLEAIFRVIRQANRYIEVVTPWQLAKGNQTARLRSVLGLLAEVIRISAMMLEPFMPAVSTSMWRQLGLEATPRRLADASRWPGFLAGHRLGPRQVLFPINPKSAIHNPQ